MSANLYLRRASAADIARYLRRGVEDRDLDVGGDPPAADAFVRLWELERRFVAREGVAALSLAAREMLAAPLISGASAEARTPALDLGKSWRMLHFLFADEGLAGESAAAALLAGGREVGEDLGCGPARLLSAGETAGFARFLNRLDLDALSRRLDAKAMKALGVYCAGGVNRAAAQELKDHLDHYFPRLRAYVAAAAEKGEALLIWTL